MIILGYIVGVILVLQLLGLLYWWLVVVSNPDFTTADETHMVTTTDGWRIRLLRRKPARGDGEPVLLCHGLFGNHLNFEAPKGAAFVDSLCEAGFDCWMIDLRGSRSSTPAPGKNYNDATGDDLLEDDIPSSIEYIRDHTGYDKVHWVGHSLGGMLLYAYDLAYGGDLIASGTTLGAPMGFKELEFPKHLFLRKFLKYARPLAIMKLQVWAPFIRLFPVHLRIFPVNWANMHPGVDTQVFVNILEPPPYGVAEDLAHWAESHEWRMCEGELCVERDLSEVETPLLLVYGAADPLTPHEKARAFFESLSSKDKRMVVLGTKDGFSEDYSHVDLAFALKGAEELHPIVVDWLRAHPIRQKGTARKAGAGAGASRQRTAKPADATSAVVVPMAEIDDEPAIMPDPDSSDEPRVMTDDDAVVGAADIAPATSLDELEVVRVAARKLAAKKSATKPPIAKKKPPLKTTSVKKKAVSSTAKPKAKTKPKTKVAAKAKPKAKPAASKTAPTAKKATAKPAAAKKAATRKGRTRG